MKGEGNHLKYFGSLFGHFRFNVSSGIAYELLNMNGHAMTIEKYYYMDQYHTFLMSCGGMGSSVCPRGTFSLSLRGFSASSCLLASSSS